MRLRALRRSIVLAACFAAALPAGAHAYASSPAIAVGADGTAHAAWLQQFGRSSLVLERRRATDGTLTDAQFVSPTGRHASDLRIAADSAGNALMAWTASDGTVSTVYSRRRTPDGALGPVQRISPVGTPAYAVAMAADSNGNAVFAWNSGGHPSMTVKTRRRTAGGVLSPTQTLSTSGEVDAPQIGLDSAGNAVISWFRRTSTTNAIGSLEIRRRAVDGTLSSTQTLATVAYPYFDLAVAADGRAAIAWEYPRTSDRLVMGRTRAANGTLSTTQTLAPPGVVSNNPSAAIDSTGRAVFAWSTHGESYIESRVRSAAGVLGTRFIVGGEIGSVNPKVEVDAEGNALFAWTTGHTTSNARTVQVRRRTAAGAMSATQDVSTPGVFAYSHTFGFDANGAAVIAWVESDSANVPIVQSRRRTPLGELSPIAKLSE